MKKRISIFIAALLALISIFSYTPGKAAAVPKLQMVTQPAVEYLPGERISFTVTSPNYGGKVEYRVILYNGTTKKTSELWPKMPGYYYKNWQPSGNYSFTINWPVVGMEPGAYSLTVLVRRVGAKGPYDSFVKTNSFWIKTAAATTETAPATKSEVKPAAPTGVWATGNSSTEMEISWDSVPGADYYKIYYSSDYNGTYKPMINSSNKENRWNLNGFFPLFIRTNSSDTTFYFKITSVKNGIESDYSEIFSAKTLPANQN